MRAFWFLLALVPLVLPPSYQTLYVFFTIGGLVALSLYLLTGLAGMTSFGQAAFMGAAAYTTGLLTVRLGLSPWLGLLAGVLVALGFALVLGGVTVRLRGHFLPLSTIAWQVAAFILAGNLVGLTGGHTGLTDLPALRLMGFPLEDPRAYGVVSGLVLALAVLALSNLRQSALGRAFLALKGEGLVAASFGGSPARLRLLAFLLSGALAGVAGFLYAHFLQKEAWWWISVEVLQKLP